MEKFEFSKFLKVKIWMPLTTDGKEYIESKASINPFQITSYHPSQIIINGNLVTVVSVCVGSSKYLVQGEYNDFDKFFDEIDRGLELKETND